MGLGVRGAVIWVVDEVEGDLLEVVEAGLVGRGVSVKGGSLVVEEEEGGLVGVVENEG